PLEETGGGIQHDDRRNGRAASDRDGTPRRDLALVREVVSEPSIRSDRATTGDPDVIIVDRRDESSNRPII
nr:hypothetical protein [Hydrococcus sp. Prado102]